MFYIFIENGKINGCGEAQQIDDNVINYEVDEAFYNKFSQNPDKYIWDGLKIIENPNYEEEQAKSRKEEFNDKFFNIEGFGYYRKQPKGYQSAVESINTAFNMVTVLGLLPANTLTFYTAPDFADAEQCTEEWLIANSFKNEVMTAQEFGEFYAKFMTAWNTQEHK